MRRKRAKTGKDWHGLILIISFGTIAIAITAALLYTVVRSPGSPQAMKQAAVPPFYSSVTAAQPLLATLDPGQFKEPKAQRAYAFARKKPAILAQQPCYCGCDRQGHRSLLECFKNEHAAGCSICIREANYASDLDAQGKCAAEIRETIIRTNWKLLGRSQ